MKYLKYNVQYRNTMNNAKTNKHYQNTLDKVPKINNTKIQ